ncbi:MAG: hypothetical protein J7577_10760 [Sphingobacteriaceae bacterium]|nr:hypothetical protein [Sphingobacteriaceae bacterium]
MIYFIVHDAGKPLIEPEQMLFKPDSSGNTFWCRYPGYAVVRRNEASATDEKDSSLLRMTEV